jgi:hypothetical protein
MKRIIIIVIVAVILLSAITFYVLKGSRTKTGINNAGNLGSYTSATDYGNQKKEPDVLEGAPINNQINRGVISVDWAKNLPYFSTYFNIFLKDNNTVVIDVPNISSTIEDRYTKEALDWLKSQGAPIDRLKIIVQ